MKNNSIAYIQFPGSNTENETVNTLKRCGFDPKPHFWNDRSCLLEDYAGYVILGGFSFEDRSRAGIIASLDPIMDILKEESKKGKPIFGICNGAQILVESGLVPGIKKNQPTISLTDNKRIKDDHIVGTGYYNRWANLKMCVPPKSTAFTRHLIFEEIINVPFAHAEGRFIIPETLLQELIDNHQTVFRYSNKDGVLKKEFPTNPNGSDYNLAAISNAKGNVLAMMPHPERTAFGDKLFSSMREFIDKKITLKKTLCPLFLIKTTLKTISQEKNQLSGLLIW